MQGGGVEQPKRCDVQAPLPMPQHPVQDVVGTSGPALGDSSGAAGSHLQSPVAGILSSKGWALACRVGAPRLLNAQCPWIVCR